MCTCTLHAFDHPSLISLISTCLQVLVPAVTWEVALDSSSRTTVVVVEEEGAGEVGVAMEEGAEETKQLDSQMGTYMYNLIC